MPLKPMVRIHDVEKDEVIDREMTTAEFAAYNAMLKAEADALLAKEKAKADKAALLERLGITDEEAKLLLS